MAVPLDSPKGQERANRIRARLGYLEHRTTGWEAKAEASAHRWALERITELEAELARQRSTITQAQAVAIIDAWREAGEQVLIADPVLDGLDLEGLAIR